MQPEIQRPSVILSMLFICTVYCSFLFCLFFQEVVGDEWTKDSPNINTNFKTPLSLNQISRYLPNLEYKIIVAKNNGLSSDQNKVLSNIIKKAKIAKQNSITNEKMQKEAQNIIKGHSEQLRDKFQRDGLVRGMAIFFLMLISIAIRCFCCFLCRCCSSKTKENAFFCLENKNAYTSSPKKQF